MYSMFLSVYRFNRIPSSVMLHRDLMIFFIFMLVLYEAYCVAEACELVTDEVCITWNRSLVIV